MNINNNIESNIKSDDINIVVVVYGVEIRNYSMDPTKELIDNNIITLFKYSIIQFILDNLNVSHKVFD